MAKDLKRSGKEGHEMCDRVVVCLERPSGGDCSDSKAICGDSKGSRNCRARTGAHKTRRSPVLLECDHARVHLAGAYGDAAMGNSHRSHPSDVIR